MARLAELPNIVGVKDATNDLTRPVNLREAVGPDFCQLSGEDATNAAFLGQGGHGIISVVANIAPRMGSQLQEAWQAGDIATFGELRDRLMPLANALFSETSPGPVKYAASVLGLCTSEVRLPLVEPAEATKARVRDALAGAGLLAEAGQPQAAE
jgi:4-hydroxy-tetrahydrodipicolinate synthase